MKQVGKDGFVFVMFMGFCLGASVMYCAVSGLRALPVDASDNKLHGTIVRVDLGKIYEYCSFQGYKWTGKYTFIYTVRLDINETMQYRVKDEVQCFQVGDRVTSYRSSKIGYLTDLRTE